MPRQTVTCPSCGAEVQVQIMVVDPRAAARARWDGTKAKVEKPAKPKLTMGEAVTKGSALCEHGSDARHCRMMTCRMRRGEV